MSRVWLSLAFVASWSVVGCGDDGSSSSDGDGEGGSGGGLSSGTGFEDEGWKDPAAETCRVSVPSLNLDLAGTGRAKRNGSGNMIVECFDFEGSEATMEIWIGNADYDGPGEYPMIDDGSRGHLTIFLDEDTSYTLVSGDSASSCDVTVEAAQRNDYPDVGTRFAGTFSCARLGLQGEPGDQVDVEDGTFDLEVF